LLLPPRLLRAVPSHAAIAAAEILLFHRDADYAAFEAILEETLESRPMRVCAYCLMPNHWHLVLWPNGDGDLAAFMQRLTITHVTRWQKHRGQVGYGHLYQGRYKCFPVESDEYFYQVVRYVERNALRADLVRQADQWRWSSLWRRLYGTREQRSLLGDWPMPMPRDWLGWVNRAETEAELEALRRSVNRSRPFGSEPWVERVVSRLRLEWTMRPRGRPRKKEHHGSRE
jgi:putative transposase